MKNVVKMGAYDKEKKEFGKRSKNTTGIFPDLNREALSFIYDVLEKHYLKHEKHDNEQLNRILDSANFSKIYAYAIDKVTPASKENKENTQGEWVKFTQGDDHIPLYESLQGHGTGWCTAGEETARTQLKNGDFYVYYSKDQDNKNTIPRIAIRMEHGQVAEVRGIEKDQNLEGNMTDIAREKYHQLPGGEKFDKKDHDMELLTLIENKIKDGKEELTKEDLRFLYEIDSKIEGFGYQEDPRIKELRNACDSEKDMLIIFDCTQEQIAHNQKEINQNTKAYVGKLTPGIFDQLPPQIEHIYTSFPGKEIVRDTIAIGGETTQSLEQKFQNADIQVTRWIKDVLLNSNEFTTLKTPEKVDLVKLQVSDLGFTSSPTTDQLYQRANELGLELCPAEVGLHYRLKYTDQPLNEWLYIGMKQITDSDGSPYVLGLGHRDGGLWVGAYWTENPANKWLLVNKLVFRHRKLAA